MSDQTTTVKGLIKTLEDGRDGFAKAGERLQNDSASDVSRKFQEFSSRRGAMADELRRGAGLSDYAVEDGTVAGAVHRGWIAVKDALTGDSPSAVISAAEQGEDHAKSKFRDALEDKSLSADVRAIVQRHAVEVEAAHDYVSSLKHANR
ncbi:MAG: PA2169 family four-helix-bundle protein [Acidimicrobiales bacterium]